MIDIWYRPIENRRGRQLCHSAWDQWII